ncbi:MAG: hypothetical protein FOGNACKC_04878 [Anaerolineae bacterium]|nr:hypothetical protein [Anaerolineae bacterium]
MDQLEIIGPNGEVEFYVLNPARGFTNIGQHPENDIVIAGPGVAPFQAILYHREKPYQLMLVTGSPETTRLGDRPLPLQQAVPVPHMGHIEFGSYTLILLETSAAPQRTAAKPAPTVTIPAPTPPAPAKPASAPVQPTPPPAKPTPPPARPATMPVAAPPARPAPRPLPVAAPANLPVVAPASAITMPDAARSGLRQPEGRYLTPVADQEDDIIVTERLTAEAAVEVEQTATYQLTIINGGDLVATFATRVEGLDEEWVTISPPHVNLYEGNRATVTITVTPPRLPSSLAGPHHFALAVTSYNYPGRISRRGATLNISPYYEFSVGEITPRQQSISWFKRSGEASIAITNKGNSNALFQVDGRDDERGCNFEFQVPGENVNLANLAEFRIPPSQTLSLPLLISPHSRKLVSLRKHAYPFTITTAMPESTQSPRSMLGRLKTAPLIGPLLLLLFGLILMVLIVIIFKPRINMFNVDGSTKKVLVAGQSATLNWKGSPFARLTIPELGAEALDSPQGSVTVVPTANASYQLKADNWLSRLNPTWFGAEPRTVSIILTPVPPIINAFGGDKEAIVTGQNVLLSWQVEGADSVALINQADGNPKPLPGSSGSLDTGPLDRETTYYLEASNPYIATPIRSDPFIIKVASPTPTPLPTPAIVSFFANPPAIVAGESTTIEWAVDGTDKVSVLGIGDGLPASQTISQAPLETTNYVLNASNGPSAAKPQSITVWVTPAPTATPEPDAPQIKFFTGDPTSLILLKGATDQVKLSWAVSGEVTNVEVSGPTLNSPITGQPSEGSLTMTVSDSTLFVLTAYNQDKKTSSTLDITVNEPTPTTTPAPTSTPLPATATPIPPATINRFVISAPGSPKVVDQGGSNPRRYQVQENTTVTFEWEVNQAAKITFVPDDGASAEVDPSGQSVLLVTVPNAGTTRNYRLIAENSESKRTTTSIEVTVVDPPPPDPPHTVTGVENTSAGQNTILWQWNSDPNKDTIQGFRVYRASVPGGSYSVIANESTLTADSPKQYVDSVTPTCGRGYYVVAVYKNVSGSSLESPASLNSWYSTACP